MRTILIAALFSLPLVAAGTTQTLAASKYGLSTTGGGSAGYNRGVATDYRLKKHKKLNNQVKSGKSAKSAKPKSRTGFDGLGARTKAASRSRVAIS